MKYPITGAEQARLRQDAKLYVVGTLGRLARLSAPPAVVKLLTSEDGEIIVEGVWVAVTVFVPAWEISAHRSQRAKEAAK